MEEADLEKIATKTWGVWKGRCDLSCKRGDQQNWASMTLQANWTEAFLDQYHLERNKLTQREIKPTNIFIPTPTEIHEDNFALKVDAAYNESTMSFAIGFCIFAPGGKLWAAGFHKINPPGSVMAAEIVAINNGVTFWLNDPRGSVSIYSDSIDAVKAIKTDSTHKGFEENLIIRARDLTRNTSVKGVWYCPRSSNTAAHNLAKLASKSPLPQDWVGDDIPRHILSLAQDHHSM